MKYGNSVWLDFDARNRYKKNKRCNSEHFKPNFVGFGGQEFFRTLFLKFLSRSDQRGCPQNEIKGDFRVQDHWLYRTTRGSLCGNG